MNRSRWIARLVLIGMLGVSQTSWASKEPTVSAQVGAQLKAGSEQLAGRNFAAALQVFQKGLTTPELTEFEKFSYQRLLVGAAFGAGNFVQAVTAAEHVLTSQYLAPAEVPYLQQTVLNSCLKLKDFNKAHALLNQWISKDPDNLQHLSMRTKVAYSGQMFDKAVLAAKAEIETSRKGNKRPDEDTLKILADSASNLGDDRLYLEGLTMLVEYYPTPDYWSDLLYRKQAQGVFKTAGDLHFYRLMSASDAWKDPGEFIDAAEAFIKAGFPREAQLTLQAGKNKGMLPNTQLGKLFEDKVRQVDSLVKQDQLSLKQLANVSSAKGDGLVSNGHNLVLYGDAQSGLGIMKQGIAKGVKNEFLANLALGEAAWLAGEKDLARSQFDSIRLKTVEGEIATLWLLKFSK